MSGQRWAKVAQKYHSSFAQSKAELNLWKDTESGNIDGQLDQVLSNVCEVAADTAKEQKIYLLRDIERLFFVVTTKEIVASAAALIRSSWMVWGHWHVFQTQLCPLFNLHLLRPVI